MMQRLLGLVLVGGGVYGVAIYVLELATAPPPNIPAPPAPGYAEL